MLILQQRTSMLPERTDLSPSDHSQYQGDNSNDQQDMNQPTRTIYKKTKYPSDDQNNSNEIQ